MLFVAGVYVDNTAFQGWLAILPFILPPVLMLMMSNATLPVVMSAIVVQTGFMITCMAGVDGLAVCE